MQLIIEIPPGRRAERKYALSVIFRDILGIEHRIRSGRRGAYRIVGMHGELLDMPDSFLSMPESLWLSRESLPKMPLMSYKPASEDVEPEVSLTIPVLFGDGGIRQEAPNHLPIDIPGATFFLLTRYEEVVSDSRDAHGRFPATASIAYRAGFLHRPLVNEYADLLFRMLRRSLPGLKRKPSQFTLRPTHDVDIPLFCKESPLGQFIRNRSGHWLKEGILTGAKTDLARWRRVRRGHAPDPYDTFDFIMDASEACGARSAFFFMAGGGEDALDGEYCLQSPGIQRLLRRIFDRGHEIGFHPGYRAAEDPAQWQMELRRLKKAAPYARICGGRQHYLRTKVPDTWHRWDQAGLTYDSSFGFADRIGFRCGICVDYPVFDLRSRKPLALKERPLAAMEWSLLSEKYMGVGIGPEAFEALDGLKRTCRRHGGDFVLLWHNHLLETDAQKDFYRQLLLS